MELIGLPASTLKNKRLKCVELFCGAGGTSTAIIEVAKAFDLYCELTGVNHWPIAIETHRKNHPEAELFCEDLHGSNPYRIFKEFELGALWASPSCFVAGTMVLTTKGLQPIEHIQIGEKVLTHRARLEGSKPNLPQLRQNMH
jgi:hypothetical protein